MHRLFSKNFLKNYMDIPFLAKEWANLHVAENLVADWKEFVSLLADYSENTRYYHALPHLVHGLKEINRLGKGLPNLHVVKLAFFFHDCVYDAKVRGGGNEAASARLMVAYAAKQGFPAHTIRNAERLIIDSANHGASASRAVIWQVFSDADLSILGTDWKIYLRYAQNIYREFSLAGATPDQFVAGRLNFLKSTLDKRIYHLKEMRSFEAQAKANMQAEIDTLLNNPELITGKAA